ncbi:MAG: hypothetical protein Q7R77_00940 [Candidatus Daviesbacteria bacterium]|nr:hypothetical protein [Candidatus Daviesbacteria bacterium]
MSEFINFLQTNFTTLTTIFGGTGAVVAAYLYNTRHHRYGYRTGKKVVTRFRPEINKRLTSPHSQKSMQERVDMVKDMVFQMGLSEYIKDYNQNVGRLQEQIGSLKEELDGKKQIATRVYRERDKKLEEEIKELETNLDLKEKELFQLKREEDGKNEVLEQNNKVNVQRKYFFSDLIQKTKESLSKAAERLETDALRYVYIIVIGLLLAGDFYITYFIFNDVLKIQFKDNRIAIYIFSGIVALVFLVLIDRVIDFLEKSPFFRKHLRKLQTGTMLVVGLILMTIYILMVSLSWLSNVPEVLDSLLRLLFVPLIIAVAITIRKVQKEYGFSFLFTPIKVIFAIFLITLFNVLLLFEVGLDYIRKYLQKEKFESKTKMTVAEEIENNRAEIARRNGLRMSLEERLEIDINKLSEHYQGLINKLDEKLERINGEMVKIRKGYESGVVAALKLPDQ